MQGISFKIWLIVFSLLITFVDKTFAANWVTISHNSSNSSSQVDTQSIRITGTKTIAWIKTVYNSPDQITPDTLKRYQTSLQLYSFQCKDRTAALLQFFLYPDTNMLYDIYHETRQDVPSLNTIPRPNSLEEAALKFTCTYKGK